MSKLILTIMLLFCALAGVLWTRLAIAENPPAGEPAAELPKTKINEKDGAEMVLIPAGEFLMGTSEEELAAWLQAHPADQRGYFTVEMPQHMVYLDDYYMYKTEVTVAQYREFCQTTGRAMPPEPDWKWQDTHPIVNVAWEDAAAYAQWANAALPTEAQWEKAARGTDGRIYTWGNEWDAGKCVNSNNSGGHTKPVGSLPADTSPYGCLDIVGNVCEWCADWYDAGYYKNAPARNPTGTATGQWRVLRGGSWRGSNPVIFRSSIRGINPSGRSRDLGFRCVLRSPGQ